MTEEISHGQTCPSGESERRYFGCDGPTGQWFVPCWGKPCGDECETCGGEGIITFSRCPLGGITPEEFALFDAWAFLNKHGILPEAGGYWDQSGVFVEAAKILDAESARWDRIKESESK